MPGRGPSSLLTTVPSGSVTGTISRSKMPVSWAATARSCERLAYASWSSRETPYFAATFSAVMPIAMYASGSPGSLPCRCSFWSSGCAASTWPL